MVDDGATGGGAGGRQCREWTQQTRRLPQRWSAPTRADARARSRTAINRPPPLPSTALFPGPTATPPPALQSFPPPLPIRYPKRRPRANSSADDLASSPREQEARALQCLARWPLRPRPLRVLRSLCLRACREQASAVRAARPRPASTAQGPAARPSRACSAWDPQKVRSMSSVLWMADAAQPTQWSRSAATKTALARRGYHRPLLASSHAHTHPPTHTHTHTHTDTHTQTHKTRTHARTHFAPLCCCP
jgi:hypothetical protein